MSDGTPIFVCEFMKGGIALPTVKKVADMPPSTPKRGRGRPKKPKAAEPPVAPKIDFENMPPIYKCSACGLTTANPSKFYVCNNAEHLKGNDRYTTICSNCANQKFTEYKQRFDNEKFALLMICSLLGCYYSDQLVTTMQDSGKDVQLGYYFRALNGLQYKGKSFATYLLELKNEDKVFQSKEAITEFMESKWTAADRRNKNYITSSLGYDPFEDDDNYSDSDKRYLYNTMSAYLTDDMLEDPHRVTSIVSIVTNLLQIRKLNIFENRQINSLSPDYAIIRNISDTKNKLQSSVNDLAEKIGITLSGAGKKARSASSFTTIMKEMIDNNYDDVKANLIDAKMTEGYQTVASISIKAMLDELSFTSDEYKDMVKEQREIIQQLTYAIDKAKEDNRLLKIELRKWEDDARLRKATRLETIDDNETPALVKGGE